MRERCPKCGIPTLENPPEDVTPEELLCSVCYLDLEKEWHREQEELKQSNERLKQSQKGEENGS